MKSEEWGLEPKKKETPGKLTQRKGHVKTQEMTYKLKKKTRKKIFSHLFELSASRTLRDSSLCVLSCTIWHFCFGDHIKLILPSSQKKLVSFSFFLAQLSNVCISQLMILLNDINDIIKLIIK